MTPTGTAAEKDQGENAPMRRGLRMAAVSCTCVLMLAGCMWFCPAASPHRVTQFGGVQYLDFATCRRLYVSEQRATRDQEGRLTVRVAWHNRDDGEYRAEVRVAFFDGDGNRETGSYRWDLHRFDPGASRCEWTSYQQNAVRYRIEVRAEQ